MAADTPPIITTPDLIVAPGINSFIASRPNSLQYINYGAGVYSHLFTGMRAQVSLALRRQALLASASRLPLAEGADLLDLAAGEFDTEIDPTPLFGLGEITITRPDPTIAGVIRKGTRFVRKGNPAGVPLPVQAGSYETIADVFVPNNVGEVVLAIRSTNTGVAANHLWDGQTGLFSIATTLFDPTFTVTTSGVPYQVAGATSGPSDDYIRLTAKKYSVGQYAPNERALIAGMLLAGAGHVAVLSDPYTGIANAYIYDQNWSSSQNWVNSIVAQFIDDDFLGFGCKIAVPVLENAFVHINVTVVLRDPALLNGDLSDVTDSVQAALRSYFDDRLDWYTWSLAGIKATVTRAHAHILNCTTAAVTTADGLGTLAPPPAKLNISSTPTHYYLADNSVTITYQSPN